MKKTGKQHKQLAVTVSIAILATVTLICIFLTVTHWLASRSFERLIVSSDVELAQVEADIIEPDGRLRSEIQPEKLERLVGEFDVHRQTINNIRRQIVAGDGMLFWLPSRRDEADKSIKERIDRLTDIVANAPTALRAVATIRNQAVDVMSQALAARAAAIVSLSEDADTGDFERSVLSLETQIQKLQTVARSADDLRSFNSLSGNAAELNAAELRRALFQGISAQVKKEADKARVRIGKTHQAMVLLAKHREALLSMVSAMNEDLSTLTGIASELQSGVMVAHSYSKPLREFLKQADEPIISGMMRVVLSTAIGGGNNVSALSLVKQVNPAAGTALDVIEGLCTLVETADGEIFRIINLNVPLAAAIDTFISIDTRRSMIPLARASKNAANYYSSKTAVFDPVLSKIEEAKDYVKLLNQVANRIPVALAQSIVLNIANGTSRLIDAIGQPFGRGKILIAKLAHTLERVSAQEEAYLREMKSLAAES